MSMRIVATLGVAAWVGQAALAFAQTSEPLVTDRPDFTESPRVVGPRVWQFESGMGWERNVVDDIAFRRFTAPEALVRLGFNTRLELRAAMDGVVREHTGRPRTEWRTSASDVALGVKYQMAHQSGLGLDLAVLAHVSLPTGGVVSSGNADPSVTVAWGRDFGSAGLTGNFNWAAPTGFSRRARVLESSLSLGHPLWGSWGAFWEGVVSDVDDVDATARWTGNTGVTRLFGNDLQVDVHVGRGLNDAAPDWAFGAGVSFRFRR